MRPLRSRQTLRVRSLLSSPVTALLLLTGMGANAAELPVAEPEENARICNEGATGYFRVPWTYLCLRIGGDVYADYSVGVGREISFTTGYEDGAPKAEYRTEGIRDIFNGPSSYGTVRLRARSETDHGS